MVGYLLRNKLARRCILIKHDSILETEKPLWSNFEGNGLLRLKYNVKTYASFLPKRIKIKSSCNLDDRILFCDFLAASLF